MYRLTTIKRLIRRGGREFGLMAVAVAALISLSAQPALAQPQGNTNNAGPSPRPQTLRTMILMGINRINDAGTMTVVHAGPIGLVPGQSVNVSVPNSYIQDGSVSFFVKHSIKVYETRISHGITERTSGLVYSGESGGLNEAMHIFTFSYSDLSVSGDPRTARKDVWLEVESFPPSSTTTSVDVLIQNVSEPPSFELIGPDGKTTIFGLLSPAIIKVTDKEGQYECTFCVKALSTIHAPVQAQEVKSFYAFGNFQGGVSVGAAAGQTIRILVEAYDVDGGSLNKPSGESGVIVGSVTSAMHVKAFNAATGALLWSRELTSPTPGLHIFDINRDELSEVGNPGTGRIQFRIEVVIGGMNVSLPIFEVFDNESGKTIVRGGVARLGSKLLVIQGDGTYTGSATSPAPR
jgi:hypothetical protein